MLIFSIRSDQVFQVSHLDLHVYFQLSVGFYQEVASPFVQVALFAQHNDLSLVSTLVKKTLVSTLL